MYEVERKKNRDPVIWPRPEFRLEAPQISFINLPDSGPNLQKIRLKNRQLTDAVKIYCVPVTAVTGLLQDTRLRS